MKNVAFAMDADGEWRLAPAYDLTYSPSRGGGRGMSVGGVERGVTWRAVELLAARHGVKRARVSEIRERVEASVGRWAQFAEDAQVPSASVAELAKAISVRSELLGG